MRRRPVEEGIEMVRQAAKRGEPYEIAFVDWQMPGSTASRQASAFVRCPISILLPHLVMVTAYGREDVMKQAEENGFENVLIKPVTSSILFDTAVAALSADSEVTTMRPATPSLRHRPNTRRARVIGGGQRDQSGSRHRAA